MAGKKGRSGRQKEESKDFERDFIEAVKRYIVELSEEYGEHPVKAGLRLMYVEDVQDSVRANILKTICDFHKQPSSKLKVDITTPSGPAIGLPPKPDESESE